MLVRVGVHSRVVHFDDKEALYSNIRAAFSDVSQVGAPNNASANQGPDSCREQASRCSEGGSNSSS